MGRRASHSVVHVLLVFAIGLLAANMATKVDTAEGNQQTMIYITTSGKALCTSATCPIGSVKKMNSDNLQCDGFTCQMEQGAADYDKCCTARAKCSSASCPAGSMKAPNSDGSLCQGFACDLSRIGSDDGHTCCVQCPSNCVQCLSNCLQCGADDDGMCDQCTAGYDLKSNVCQEVQCPTHSVGLNVGAGCTCVQGFNGTIAASPNPPFYTGQCTSMPYFLIKQNALCSKGLFAKFRESTVAKCYEKCGLSPWCRFFAVTVKGGRKCKLFTGGQTCKTYIEKPGALLYEMQGWQTPDKRNKMG